MQELINRKIIPFVVLFLSNMKKRLVELANTPRIRVVHRLRILHQHRQRQWVLVVHYVSPHTFNSKNRLKVGHPSHPKPLLLCPKQFSSHPLGINHNNCQHICKLRWVLIHTKQKCSSKYFTLLLISQFFSIFKYLRFHTVSHYFQIYNSSPL